ncbi:toll/interleukin-1 receptor domain-containing protein [Rhizobium herbae]|uniref:TIR domain-containing protein n=1 Tax=Rhizobium herbae TaxID=508661 RepID=A0ABS4EIJ3_9HYPH|nr:toll/interleukin-1 receptor domain-containing protein [Rhizobium herbae]MBP1857775.1 hypothetical protein [Rhizobium herbae]
MKIFISWSGDYSKHLAIALRDWIPCVIQSCEVFVSAHDIGAGERWQNKINSALDQIDFGIVILTSENKDRPWINFEAGALAKHLERSRVMPILCGMKLLELSSSPLNQFQCVNLDKSGINSVMTSLFEGLSDDDALTEIVFSRTFETWWPNLDGQIEDINSTKKKTTEPKKTEEDRIGNIEKAVSDIIGLIQNKEPSAKPIATTREISAEEFFTLPDSEIMTARVTARAITAKAKSKSEIERAINYISKRKPITLQKSHLPTLREKLAALDGE